MLLNIVRVALILTVIAILVYAWRIALFGEEEYLDDGGGYGENQD